MNNRVSLQRAGGVWGGGGRLSWRPHHQITVPSERGFRRTGGRRMRQSGPRSDVTTPLVLMKKTGEMSTHYARTLPLSDAPGGGKRRLPLMGKIDEIFSTARRWMRVKNNKKKVFISMKSH
jgi:hypothetical protein